MAWHLIGRGGPESEFGVAKKEFMIDDEADIQNEPTEFGPIAMSSIARIDFEKMWEKKADGTWKRVV